MTTTTFFFIFIPLLAFILLAVNLIFAPHNPYQEKDSVFECGFHSFLGQNRTQFSISFFIFALLFLLFDLEILLVYPYIVSAYTNSTYGLVIMLIFFSVLTIGFVFELGKNALKIDSRQVFSLPKVQQTTTITVLSGFFSRNSFAIFRGMFKIKHLKLALKKVFGFYTLSIMFLAFTVTTMMRIYIIKHQPQYLVIESDLLFYISSISTIFTATSIRKYFQLFNPFFESIEWHSVYHFFTCSKTERSKLLQDFIKSLEEFNNEKIKVNNTENSLEDNLSLKKDNTKNLVSKMEGSPSNSLTKASGSGNNNASGSRASGSGNNNTTVTRASGSGNNNTTVTRPSGSNNLIQTGLSQSENSQLVRAANLARGVNNNNQPLTSEALKEWEQIQRQTPGTTRIWDSGTIGRSTSGTLFSSHNSTLSSYHMPNSRYIGPLHHLFASIQRDCTPNWLSAIKNIYLNHSHVVTVFTDDDSVQLDYANMVQILARIMQNVTSVNITEKVGSCVGWKEINGIILRYPFLFNAENTHEPSVLQILLHLGTCLDYVDRQASEFVSRFTYLEQYMSIPYDHNCTIALYKDANPEAYNHINKIVQEFGDPVLKDYFSKGNNPIVYIYISLENAHHKLISNTLKYEQILRRVESIVQSSGLSKEELASKIDILHTQGHIPIMSYGLNVKLTWVRNL